MEEELSALGLKSYGKNVLISRKCSVYSAENIEIGNNVRIDDFVNISSRVVIYAISDDYSGESMTNPMIPEKYKALQRGKVVIYKHVIIGTGSIVLPGVGLNEGSAAGSMSLVLLNRWCINVQKNIRVILRTSRCL